MIDKLLKFRQAVVREFPTTGFVVEFYVYDPQGDAMVRQRYRINKQVSTAKNKRDRMRMAQKIADDITIRLSNGWSPIHETQSPRLCTPIDVLQKKYIESKTQEGKRDATLQSYRSMTGIFAKYVMETQGVPKTSGYFLKEHAVAYMEHVREKGNSNRNYNNTIKQIKALFSWAVEHCYSKENPFDGIKLLEKQDKTRTLISSEYRDKIDNYLRYNNPQFLLFLRLVYAAQIRPKEALQIKLGWIDISRHCIVLPGEITKNKKTRCASFTPDIEADLIRFGQKPLDWYLFGKGETMLPNDKPCASSTPRHKWDRLREVLKLPKEMQMYSFRDTGIIDMEHSGIDQLTVQHHSDHSSLRVQQIYTDHYDPTVNETIYTKAPQFSNKKK